MLYILYTCVCMYVYINAITMSDMNTPGACQLGVYPKKAWAAPVAKPE